ncbi:MAG TPA: outer membrane protein assembly factor BamD [Candidatus Nitrosotalea sp.]|nr:outer membrane protein assembly factor BamD [Candidatus Nitrosotalea sp.]
MNRWSVRSALIILCILAFPFTCPAPLVYTPGEGWTYESVGGGKWRRSRAKDQLETAQQAFDNQDYSIAIKAARRTVSVWPLSDYAPKAQYLLGLCYQAKGDDEKAFKTYQTLLEKYPKFENYDGVLKRQFEIANKYLAGKWFKLWGFIPFFPSMDKTADMYLKIVKNGPYSDVAPRSQLNIGAAREKQVSFFNRFDPFREAVKAYEVAADRYRDDRKIASEAIYKEGVAYYRQAQKAEYDQSVAGQAISTFSDFAALFPGDPRIPETQKFIGALKNDQARGDYNIARFYESKKRWQAAAIYYNQVGIKDPNSKYAQESKQRIEAIRKRIQGTPPPNTPPTPPAK